MKREAPDAEQQQQQQQPNGLKGLLASLIEERKALEAARPSDPNSVQARLALPRSLLDRALARMRQSQPSQPSQQQQHLRPSLVLSVLPNGTFVLDGQSAQPHATHAHATRAFLQDVDWGLLTRDVAALIEDSCGGGGADACDPLGDGCAVVELRDFRGLPPQAPPAVVHLLLRPSPPHLPAIVAGPARAGRWAPPDAAEAAALLRLRPRLCLAPGAAECQAIFAAHWARQRYALKRRRATAAHDLSGVRVSPAAAAALAQAQAARMAQEMPSLPLAAAAPLAKRCRGDADDDARMPRLLRFLLTRRSPLARAAQLPYSSQHLHADPPPECCAPLPAPAPLPEAPRTPVEIVAQMQHSAERRMQELRDVISGGRVSDVWANAVLVERSPDEIEALLVATPTSGPMRISLGSFVDARKFFFELGRVQERESTSFTHAASASTSHQGNGGTQLQTSHHMPSQQQQQQQQQIQHNLPLQHPITTYAQATDPATAAMMAQARVQQAQRQQILQQQQQQQQQQQHQPPPALSQQQQQGLQSSQSVYDARNSAVRQQYLSQKHPTYEVAMHQQQQQQLQQQLQHQLQQTAMLKQLQQHSHSMQLQFQRSQAPSLLQQPVPVTPNPAMGVVSPAAVQAARSIRAPVTAASEVPVTVSPPPPQPSGQAQPGRFAPQSFTSGPVSLQIAAQQTAQWKAASMQQRPAGGAAGTIPPVSSSTIPQPNFAILNPAHLTVGLPHVVLSTDLAAAQKLSQQQHPR